MKRIYTLGQNVWLKLSIPFVLTTLYAIYSFGFGGIFFFDDAAAFEGLVSVKDWNTALAYVFDGTAGPLGRPISLATFLLHTSAYPDDAKPFFIVNVLIHLCNVAIVTLIAWQLQQCSVRLFPQSVWFAPAVGGFWGTLPILASTSLMAVQRMTSLSAFFVFVGVSVFLWAKQREDNLPSVILALVGLATCTLLAAYSKENGVLLPILLVVLAYTLDQERQRGASTYSALLTISVVLPTLIIAGYIAFRSLTVADTYGSRPFDLWARLATQTVILWEYLRVAFFPSVMDLSPFRDDYTIYRFRDGPVVLASLGWIAAISTAALLRKRQPLILFALAWFLGGHLLESTIFPLHLYFEHRNYVPLVGPIIAVTAVVFQSRGNGVLKTIVGGCYILFLVFILWQAVSIWGNRQQLIWAYEHPTSPRAVQTIAGAYLQAGRVSDAAALYERSYDRFPAMTSAAMQGLQLSCYHESADDAQRWLAVMQRTLGKSDYSVLALQSLQAISLLHANGRCIHLRAEDLRMLIDLLLVNPAFQSNNARQILHRLNVELNARERAG